MRRAGAAEPVPAPASETVAAAIDLGTTFIKGGLLRPDGFSGALVWRPAPALEGAGLNRESSADAYREAATGVLEDLLANAAPGLPIGVASQRSSFVIWDRRTGAAATPLLSWQDRRATGWCERHPDLEAEIVQRTGLRLSPHYAGPKLAALLESESGLERGLREGTLLFGTLDSYLLWHWSRGRCHETDLTMAARTLLADPGSGRWSEPLLARFGVAPHALPRIVPSSGRATPVDGGAVLTASIADQAAAVLAVLGTETHGAVVTLGTGGFVVRPTGRAMISRPGYLAGPIFGGRTESLYAVEGTINGAAAAADRFGDGPCELPREDPSPDAFCLPDLAGVGAPHWLPDRTLTLSPAAEALGRADRRRIALEGILFRTREILEDLGFGPGPGTGGGPGERAGGDEDPVGLAARNADPGVVCLAGGLARDPFVAPALAACLDRPVQLVEEADATLLGAARLAVGLAGQAVELSRRPVPPGPAGRYLAAKFERWRTWLARVLGPEGRGR